MSKIIPLNETTSVSEMKLTENKKQGSVVLGTIRGPFAEIENENRNGRVYSRQLWESVINSDYVKEMLEFNTLYGEADHPEDRFEISLPEVSHVVTKLWIDDNKGKVMGEADILDTPKGRILNTVVKYGSKIGISARAAGSLQEENGVKRVVEDDYTFFTFDTVPNPGFKTTRMDEIDKSNRMVAGNDRLAENMDKSELEDMKNEILEEVKRTKDENLNLVRSVVESIQLDEENYNEIIDIIENRIEGTENVSMKNESNESMQEDTLSLLEESQRKVYKLEKENKKLEERIESLQDEVNDLSEKSGEDSQEMSLDEEMYKVELSESRERIEKLEGLVKELKNKLKSVKEEPEEEEEEPLITEDQLESLDKSITGLKRKVKSKMIYIDELENRLKEVSESKVDIEKVKSDEVKNIKESNDKLDSKVKDLKEENKELESSLENLSHKYVAFENYVIEKIAGRTGASQELVRKYIPENFSIEDIVSLEKKIKKDLGKDNKKKFDKVVEVNENTTVGKEDNESETNIKKLSSLVQRNKSK